MGASHARVRLREIKAGCARFLHSQVFTLRVYFVLLIWKLLSQAKLFDDSTVSLNVNLLEVAKEVTSVTNHLQKTSTAVVVILVVLQVLVQVVDTACEKSNLYLRRTCVTLVCCVSSNDFVLVHFFHLIKIFYKPKYCASGLR
jgi:archaellum biogenesis protein FlaJ (TadC family)